MGRFAYVGVLGALSLSSIGACTKKAEPELTAEQKLCEEEKLNYLYARLSCTGLYTDIAAKTVSPSARAYAPGVVLWSDGAEKTRYIALPPGTKIDTTDMDQWVFPVGTKAWKEFRIGGKRIETRLYFKETEFDWRKTTYRWNDAEAEAFRLDVGEKDIGGTKFEVPETTKCDSCHDGGRDKLLGFEAVSLALPSAEGLTLRVLAEEGLITNVPAKTTLVLPDDGKGSSPALGYMHANCGVSCHSHFDYSPLSYVGLDLRLYASALLSDTPPPVSELEVWKTTVGKSVKVSSPGLPPVRIAKGNPADSAVLYLTARRSDTDENRQMPPIGTHVVDEASVNALRAWITAIQ